LVKVRTENCGLESAEEEEILDHLDVIWKAVPPEDQITRICGNPEAIERKGDNGG
jgi:hypothetical protein